MPPPIEVLDFGDWCRIPQTWEEILVFSDTSAKEEPKEGDDAPPPEGVRLLQEEQEFDQEISDAEEERLEAERDAILEKQEGETAQDVQVPEYFGINTNF